MAKKPMLLVLAVLGAVLFVSVALRPDEKSAPAANEQEPFSIKDDRLSPVSSAPDPCHTDAEITSTTSQGYAVGGNIEISNGRMYLWCNQAKHTWIGRHENIEKGAIQVIDSSKDDPLQFKVDKEKGYVYQKGKGTVTLADNKMIELPLKPGPAAPGSAGVGPDWEGKANWPGIRFTISFSVPESSEAIHGLKVAYECTEGVGAMTFTYIEPIKLESDKSFSATVQGSRTVGRLTSEGKAEGTYKAPFSMKCGEKFVEISGNWAAEKRK